MLVRRLVTGVRSSCEASATSWRWACTEASSALIECSSASSIALKLDARAGRSRRARPLVDAPGEVLGARHVLGGAGQAPARAARPRPRPAGRAAPPARCRRARSAPGSAAAGSSRRVRLRSAAGRTAPPGPARTGSARMRRWMPSTRASLEEGLASAAPPSARVARRRAASRAARPSGTRTAAGRVHELLIAARPGRGAAWRLPKGCPLEPARDRAAGTGGVTVRELASEERHGRASSVAQLGVDLSAQLVRDEQVGERRGEHDRDRDGRGGGRA